MDGQVHGSAWVPVTAVLAALGASLCCILPVTVALLGVGSAAFGALLAPLRPYLIGLTFVFLGFAFYQAYKPAKNGCAPGEPCAAPENRRPRRIILWALAVVAAALTAFPYYIGWIL